MKRGIFVVAELEGAVRDEVLAIQRWADPKLTKGTTPHVTLIGSSGAGPIAPDTTAARLRTLLGPVTSDTPPMVLHFDRPVRFMQTDIIVLPLDPHGPLRTLHERIMASGLRFQPARFHFSPHCTLSYFPTMTPAMQRRLLRVRIEHPVIISRIQFYLTRDPQPARQLLELTLGMGREPAGLRNAERATGSRSRSGKLASHR